MSKMMKKAEKKTVEERRRLAEYEGSAVVFAATLVSYGRTKLRAQRPQPTILLRDLATSFGMNVCRHIWTKLDDFCNYEEFSEILKPGSHLVFSAVPYRYFQEGQGGKVRCMKYGISGIRILKVKGVELPQAS